MKKKTFIILLFLCFNLYADVYDFDVNSFEKKFFEFNGNIRLNYIYNKNNKSSEIYNLKYKEKENYSDYFSIRTESFLKLNYKDFSYFINGNINYYKKENSWEFDEILYENYLIYKKNNYNIYLGKKSLKWGKGYVWNPVNFSGKQKDIDDIDASLEGYYLFNYEYIKSYNSDFKNISFNFIILPADKNLNSDYEKYNTVNFITKLYALYYNNDIDIYALVNNKEDKKIGFDFARNLLTNWEIHFEYSYYNNFKQYFMNNNGILDNRIKSTNNFLIGTRYLTKNEVTYIFEYLHNSEGLTNAQTDLFYKTYYNAINNNNNISYYKNTLSEFSKQFISKDYLYLKLSANQPYDILYFTPSFYSLYNINDKSVNNSLELKYTGITNLELLVKSSYLSGKSFSQYGEKINEQKYDFQLKYYF